MLLGFGTGTYGVLVGAGGGFILGPALLIFFDIEPQVVAGTVLALVAINSIAGSAAYLRRGLVDRRSALLFAAAAIPGSILAPFIVAEVGGGTFKILFGVLLVALGVQILVRPRMPEGSTKSTGQDVGRFVKSRHITTAGGQEYRYSFNEAAATSFNSVLGFLSSFFGTGGGFLRTPILVSVFGFPVRVAVATSILTMSFYATAGAVTHASLGHVEWYPILMWAGIGLVAGGQVGASLALKVRGPWILRMLLVVVLAVGIKLLIEGVQG